MNLLRKFLSPTWRPASAASAGLLATIAYSIAMEGDKFLIGNRFSDVRFIQGLIGARGGRRTLTLSWVLHLLNGVLLGELYAALVKRFLPGPDWLKGVIFGEVFIIGAWGLTPLADKYHPFIKNGELPRLATWTSFLQNLLRHLVFGLVLGWLYREKSS
ncbi:DUF6789 family protein [Tengunoibacter tsumagoiensis]|uniref:DUF2938 domain-containing protein n=1 Tax=Tengunoibacter tsumagoiensis TaxID=2014871 RepID=A0A402A5M4_9CHLR|nr:DUF6789 family protein [Tengunoibacter tsumagoiensis]GCE14325.1 hypothetical protein KTT_41840 [Tengunoibacter tsumagoiensis]